MHSTAGGVPRLDFGVAGAAAAAAGLPKEVISAWGGQEAVIERLPRVRRNRGNVRRQCCGRYHRCYHGSCMRGWNGVTASKQGCAVREQEGFMRPCEAPRTRRPGSWGQALCYSCTSRIPEGFQLTLRKPLGFDTRADNPLCCLNFHSVVPPPIASPVLLLSKQSSAPITPDRDRPHALLN